VCYNDEINANQEHITITRDAPTLQTISAALIESEQQCWLHYHRYLRDNDGSNWQDSIAPGDCLEVAYDSLFKSRLRNAAQSSASNRHTALHYDMPKWIPVQVTARAYSATIEFAQETPANDDESLPLPSRTRRALQQTITVGRYSAPFAVQCKSARIRAIDDSAPLYLRVGSRIEILDAGTREWSAATILSLTPFIEFRFWTHSRECCLDSCYLDELNVRLASASIPSRAFSSADVGRSVRVYWSHRGGGEWYSATIQSVDVERQILVVFYDDRYLEEL
jgi:hypothetical protein